MICIFTMSIFATDVDTDTETVENSVPDFSQFYNSTFLITEYQGNYYAYTCLPQYNLYLSSSSGTFYILANPSIVDKYKFVDGVWKYIISNSSTDTAHSFRVIFSATGYAETFLYSNCDITYVNSEGIYFKQNINNDNIPDEDDTDIIVDSDTVNIDFDNTATAQKISKFIDTFSSLFRLLFVFFLMVILYKFFKIFF